MVHLDVGVLGEIKRRQAIEENDKEKEKHANKRKGTGSESAANATKVLTTVVRIKKQHAPGFSRMSSVPIQSKGFERDRTSELINEIEDL